MRYVPTNELKAGDIVHAHGARFRCTAYATHPSPMNDNTVIYAWYTEYVDGRFAGPSHWKDNWVIQGNHLALWTVE